MLMDHPYEASQNPRKANSCAQCGRIRSWHPEPPRRPEFEQRFLSDMAELVGQIRGMSHNPAAVDQFCKKVLHRLEIGSERYGDREFLRRDNLVEVDEECPDVPAYGMLELQRHLHDGVSEDDLSEMRVDLVCAAAHAAIADQYARQAKMKRTELGL